MSRGRYRIVGAVLGFGRSAKSDDDVSLQRDVREKRAQREGLPLCRPTMRSISWSSGRS
jgi:hypothetical protein